MCSPPPPRGLGEILLTFGFRDSAHIDSLGSVRVETLIGSEICRQQTAVAAESQGRRRHAMLEEDDSFQTGFN